MDPSQHLRTLESSRPLLKPSAALQRFAPSRQRLLDTAPVAEQQIRYGYRIGDIGLLIGSRALCEVIPPPAPARIPATPHWFRGVMNLRGGLVPVFDLRALLELPPQSTSQLPTGLVLDSGEHAAALVVDGNPQPLRSLSVFGSQTPMPALLRPFVSTTWAQGRDIWFELNHRQFFASLATQMSALTGTNS